MPYRLLGKMASFWESFSGRRCPYIMIDPRNLPLLPAATNEAARVAFRRTTASSERLPLPPCLRSLHVATTAGIFGKH